MTTMAPTFVLPFPKMYLFWFSMDLYLNNYGVHSTQTLLPVSLATRIRANSVQAGGHCLPSSSRHCSSVSLRSTYCIALLTYRQDVVFDRRSLIVLTSVRPASSLSATAHFLLPAPRCGTVCQMTLHLPRRCQCFLVN